MPKREQLEAMLADDPEDVFLNYALAQVFASDGDPRAAIAQYERVIAIDADHVPAYFQRGQLFARAGNETAARESLHAGIEVARRTGDDHALAEMTDFLAMLD